MKNFFKKMVDWSKSHVWQTVLIGVAIVGVVATSIALPIALSNKDDSGQHTHTFSSDWKSDENSHWKVCECGEKSELASHLDNNHDDKCDVCGKVLPHQHWYLDDYEYDDFNLYHWHIPGCGHEDAIQYEPHNYTVYGVCECGSTLCEHLYEGDNDIPNLKYGEVAYYAVFLEEGGYSFSIAQSYMSIDIYIEENGESAVSTNISVHPTSETIYTVKERQCVYVVVTNNNGYEVSGLKLNLKYPDPAELKFLPAFVTEKTYDKQPFKTPVKGIDFSTTSPGEVTITWGKGLDKLPGSPVGVGSYSVNIKVAATTSYAGESISENIKILQKELSVGKKIFTPNGQSSFTCPITFGVVEGDIVNATYTFDGAEIGAHLVEVTLDNPNYKFASTPTAEIGTKHNYNYKGECTDPGCDSNVCNLINSYGPTINIDVAEGKAYIGFKISSKANISISVYFPGYLSGEISSLSPKALKSVSFYDKDGQSISSGFYFDSMMRYQIWSTTSPLAPSSDYYYVVIEFNEDAFNQVSTGTFYSGAYGTSFSAKDITDMSNYPHKEDDDDGK